MTDPTPPRPRRALAIALGVGIPLLVLAVVAALLLFVLPGAQQGAQDTDAVVVNEKAPTIEVDQKAYGFNGTTWVVPVDADWAGLPLETSVETGVGCTDDQLEWLDDNGVSSQQDVLFELGNDERDATLTVADVRLDGKLTDGEASLRVLCGETGGGSATSTTVYTSLQAGTSEPAVVRPASEELTEADEDYAPGDEIEFTLEPDDSVRLAVQLLPPADGRIFTGSLVATVSSEGDEHDVTLEPDGEETFTLASPTLATAVVAIYGGVARCGTEGSRVPCDTAEIVDRLGRGWDSPATAVWTGPIAGDTTAYSVHVTITDDGVTASATAAYPEVPCTSTWTQTSRSGPSISFLETVGSDSPCYDNVPLTVTLNADGTLFYTALSNGRTITSTLTRSG